MFALDVSHLKKSYGDTAAVKDLSFQVNSGEIYGLIGPNGAGKSTTMLMIVGLLSPDQGTIRLEDQDFQFHDPSMRRRLGFVPQDISLYPELNAAQNLRFFGRLYGLRGRRLKERVDQILNIAGLVDNADHRINSFSGGMKRRLNFGVALLHNPELVVLDEPTVGIDPQSRSHLLECIRELGHQGVGVVYATHYMEEVEAVCHRIGIMDRGKLLREGTLDELLSGERMNVSIKIPQIPPELRRKLQESAQIESDSETHVTFVIHSNSEDSSVSQTDQLRRVIDLLDLEKVSIQSIETRKPSLEQLFLKLTGRNLRD